MTEVGIFFVIMGLCFIIFRRQIGHVGSDGRARLRRWVPMPDDEANTAMTGFVGWAWLIAGILTTALSLAL